MATVLIQQLLLVTAYTWPRTGQTYTASGTHDYTFANGICTDTIRLLLTITNGNRTDTTATACNSFTWPRTGQTYTARYTWIIFCLNVYLYDTNDCCDYHITGNRT
jgi:hypothetical protein